MKHYKTPKQFALLAWFVVATVVVILLVTALHMLSCIFYVIAKLSKTAEVCLDIIIELIIDFKDKIAPQPCQIAKLVDPEE